MISFRDKGVNFLKILRK